MTTPFLTMDISEDEAPGGQPVLVAYPDPLSPLGKWRKANPDSAVEPGGLVGSPWTIGYGSTGEDIHSGVTWTVEQCNARRDFDIAKLMEQFSHFTWWEHCNDERQDVFVNMGYQIGFAGVLKFVKALEAAGKSDWAEVAKELQDSLWDRQTHARAERLAEQMRTGVRKPQPYDSVVQPKLEVQHAPEPQETKMSWVSKFIFNPIETAVARALASHSPDAQTLGQAVKEVIGSVGTTEQPGDNSHLSPQGITNPAIADLETLLKAAVDKFVFTTVAGGVPVVGALIAPEAVKLADMALTFAEQHAISYVAALFSHHKDGVAASAN